MSDPVTRLNTALEGRYRIERKLGEGGMATVYLAQDLKHGRRVALKVMRPEFTADLGADRFLREIDIAAGLTHPHILSVHDSGNEGGLLYYVMPFVDGESLLARLEREGHLPVEESVRIARQIGDALDHAHRHGVVHRDVKPANVLISEGHAYVADFGVARFLGVTASPILTSAGTTVGTPHYMSPEQALGQADLDGRSDIYSLGCVLYEMLAGTPPFSGPTPQAVIVKRITETPKPIRQIRPEVPPGVERALAKALTIEPEERWQSARAFTEALTPASGPVWHAGSLWRRLRYGFRSTFYARPALASAVGAVVLAGVAGLVWMGVSLAGVGRGVASGPPTMGPAGPTETRVAILVFDDLSPAGSLEPYAAGFTKALIRSINSVDGLAAQSFQAVRQFHGSMASPDSIARALEVDYVVEGAVLPTASGMRVDVDLVNPRTGVPAAQLQHEGTSAELADLTDAIAGSLALSLRPELGEQVRLEELRAATGSDEALDMVWRAEALRGEAADLILLAKPNRLGADAALLQADSLLMRAQSLDPEWPTPLVQRAWVAHERAKTFTDVPDTYGAERLELARAGLGLAERALALDARDSEAFEVHGTILFGLARREQSDAVRDSLLSAAELDLAAAVEVDPSLATAWRSLAALRRVFRGDAEGGRQALEQAYFADRFLADAPEIALSLIEVSTDLEDYDEAWRWIEEGRRRWPDRVGFPAAALLVLASTSSPGDVDRSWAYWDTVQQTWPGDRPDIFRPAALAMIAAVLGQAGLADSARTVIDNGLAGATRGDSIFAAYYVARAYLTIGDATESLRWLTIDVTEDPGKKPYRATEPWFRPLHDDPRFEELVGGAGRSR